MAEMGCFREESLSVKVLWLSTYVTGTGMDYALGSYKHPMYMYRFVLYMKRTYKTISPVPLRHVWVGRKYCHLSVLLCTSKHMI